MRAETLKGHLDLLLLAVMEDGPRHGYAVIEELRRRTGNALDLPEGTVYPALHRLERGRAPDLELGRPDRTSPPRLRAHEQRQGRGGREAAGLAGLRTGGAGRARQGGTMAEPSLIAAYLVELRYSVANLDDVDDIVAEAEDHLLTATEAGVARGLSETDAEAEALARFGSAALVSRVCIEEAKRGGAVSTQLTRRAGVAAMIAPPLAAIGEIGNEATGRTPLHGAFVMLLTLSLCTCAVAPGGSAAATAGSGAGAVPRSGCSSRRRSSSAPFGWGAGLAFGAVQIVVVTLLGIGMIRARILPVPAVALFTLAPACTFIGVALFGAAELDMVPPAVLGAAAVALGLMWVGWVMWREPALDVRGAPQAPRWPRPDGTTAAGGAAMGVIRHILRTQLRQHWRAWTALALLIGAGASVTIALVGGAGRTRSAYDRFLVEHRAHDLTIYPRYGDECFEGFPPGVTDFGALIQGSGNVCLDSRGAAPRGRAARGASRSSPRRRPPTTATRSTSAARRRTRRSSSRRKTASSAPRSTDPTPRGPPRPTPTPSMSSRPARRWQSSSGSRSAARSTSSSSGRWTRPPPVRRVRTRRARRRHHRRHRGEVQATVGDYVAALHATPAFYRAYADQSYAGPAAAAKVRDGVTATDLQATLDGAASRWTYSLTSAPSRSPPSKRLLDAETLALRLVAAIAGVAALAFCGQALVRQLHADAEDDEALAAMGVTRPQLRATVFVRCGAIGVAGAGVGVAAAWLLSQWTLLGLAVDRRAGHWSAPRRSCCHRRRAADGRRMPCRRRSPSVADRRGAATRDATARGQRSVAVRALRPPAATGVRLALRPGRGGDAVPSVPRWPEAPSASHCWSAPVFGASLDRLLDDPRIAGWRWDTVLYEVADAPDLSIRESLLSAPDIAGVSEVNFVVGDAAGPDGVRAPLPVLGLDPLRGDVVLAVTAGRLARVDDEVALGAKTMRELDVRVGDDVLLVTEAPESEETGERGPPLEHTATVVGQVVLPSIGDRGEPGRGAALTLGGLNALRVDEGLSNESTYFVTFASDVDPEAATTRWRDAANDEDTWRRWARLTRSMRAACVGCPPASRPSSPCSASPRSRMWRSPRRGAAAATSRC